MPKTSESPAASFTSRRGGALDSLRARTERHPLEASTPAFDNETGPDFNAVFVPEAPVIAGAPADSARLKDYAMRPRDLLREGDAEALYDELRPSVDRETGWYQVTRHGRRDSAAVHIREEWDRETDFERKDVGLRKWSGGRVWELYRKPGTPLFNAGASYLKVYVAEAGGDLRIIRLTG